MAFYQNTSGQDLKFYPDGPSKPARWKADQVLDLPDDMAHVVGSQIHASQVQKVADANGTPIGTAVATGDATPVDPVSFWTTHKQCDDNAAMAGLPPFPEGTKVIAKQDALRAHLAATAGQQQ